MKVSLPPALVAMLLVATLPMTMLLMARRARRPLEVRARDDGATTSLGHDLRNSLNALLLALDVLQKHHGDTPMARHAQAIVKRQALHLSQLIEVMPRGVALAHPQAAGSSASPHLKVLVIEANANAARSMCDTLRLDGHHVERKDDGTSGLAALIEQWPDLVIADIGLPGLDGFQLARQARSRGYGGRMIAVSGDGTQSEARRAIAAGFDFHAVKPVDVRQLQQWLRQ